MRTSLIGVYSIFIVFFISSAIKNLVVNANGYSRLLRIMIVGIVIGYLLYVGFLSVKPIIAQNPMNFDTQNILSIISFFLITIISLGTLITMDFKKASVRDVWKYQAKYFSNFKTQKPFDTWGKSLLFIIYIIVLSTLALSISILVIDNNIWSKVTYGLLICHIVFNYLIFGYKRIRLLDLTAIYNLLKSYIFYNSKDIDKKTFIEVGKKALELYKIIFKDSYFYRNNINNNNAIIYEIIKRTKVKLDHESEYFVDPSTKQEINMKRYEEIMKEKENHKLNIKF